MMFLLDTDIVLELRRPEPNRSVIAWMSGVRPEEIAVPALVIGEIALAAEHLRVRDPRRADGLTDWLDTLDHNFPILAADAPVMRIWARLMQLRPRPNFNDATVAATALHHGLTVATRNVAAFMPLGVLVTNPFGKAR